MESACCWANLAIFKSHFKGALSNRVALQRCMNNQETRFSSCTAGWMCGDPWEQDCWATVCFTNTTPRPHPDLMNTSFAAEQPVQMFYLILTTAKIGVDLHEPRSTV